MSNYNAMRPPGGWPRQRATYEKSRRKSRKFSGYALPVWPYAVQGMQPVQVVSSPMETYVRMMEVTKE